MKFTGWINGTIKTFNDMRLITILQILNSLIDHNSVSLVGRICNESRFYPFENSTQSDPNAAAGFYILSVVTNNNVKTEEGWKSNPSFHKIRYRSRRADLELAKGSLVSLLGALKYDAKDQKAFVEAQQLRVISYPSKGDESPSAEAAQH